MMRVDKFIPVILDVYFISQKMRKPFQFFLGEFYRHKSIFRIFYFILFYFILFYFILFSVFIFSFFPSII